MPKPKDVDSAYISAAYSERSRESADTLPNARLATSLDAGWTSLLLELRSGGSAEPFDVLPTPDQTIVVTLRHEHMLDVFRSGHWVSVAARPAAISTSAPWESPRLRLRCSNAVRTSVTAHLYIPEEVFAETADEYRRAGQSPRRDTFSALALTDPALAEMVSAMVRAIRARAPDLYAENARRWIAGHLLLRTKAFDESWATSANVGSLSDRRLARVVEYMSTHLAKALSIEGLAAEAGVSKFHFTRLFQAKTGSTPHAYLTSMRMEAARRLLVTSDLPIESIAVMCGYPRANNFATAFRRRFACTPTECRVKAR